VGDDPKTFYFLNFKIISRSLQNYLACKGGGSAKCPGIVTAKVEIRMARTFCRLGFLRCKLFHCGDIAASTGASGRTNYREWSGCFRCGAGGDVDGGVYGDVVVFFGVGAGAGAGGDIRLSKRNIIRGSDEWCVLPPLNP